MTVTNAKRRDPNKIIPTPGLNRDSDFPIYKLSDAMLRQLLRCEEIRKVPSLRDGKRT